MILLLMVVAVTVAANPVLVLGPTLASHVFDRSASWSGSSSPRSGPAACSGHCGVPSTRLPSNWPPPFWRCSASA